MKIQLFIPVEPQTPRIFLHNKLAAKFGGCTSIPAAGTWFDDRGSLVKEPVSVETVYCCGRMDAPHEYLTEVAQSYKDASGQDMVMYTINDEPYYL
jgi:hypothetical protein